MVRSSEPLPVRGGAVPGSAEKLDRVASFDPTRLLHVTVDPQDHVGADLPIAGQHLQHIEVLLTGIGVEGGHHAPRHAPPQTDHGLTDTDPLTLPCVLVVRIRSVELDQRSESTWIESRVGASQAHVFH
jgi:hypothetical protein